MRRNGFLPLLFLSAASVSGLAQIPTPTPDRDVVRISTNLIRLDVTVTDQKGRPITDLRPDEIEIYENGEKQKITDLRFISGRKDPPPGPETARDAAPVPPVQLRPEQIRRTIAMVVDDLTLSFQSAYQTRRALKKFVDEQMADGDLVAILRTGAGIGALQQFTSDKRILYAAIEKVRWNPLGNGRISAFAPLEAELPTDEEAEEEAGTRTAAGVEQEFNDFRESYFATGTLGALDYVIRGMGELPGRKSVMLFSDGFKLTNTTATGFLDSSRTLDPLQRLIESANRSSVVIYAMDPRGLVYTGLTAADNTGGRSQTSVDSAMSGRRADLSDTQHSLRYISEATGGYALVNNNDLSGGVRKVLEEQSYYLVAYEPDTDTFDPQKRRFNKIDIKVLRAGAAARYRSGFFNVADRQTLPAATTSVAADLERALVSPFSVAGITVRLNALFGNDAKHVSYVRSLLHINAADLKFIDMEDGTKKAAFDILAMSFGENGQPVDQLARSYTLTLKPEGYKRMLAEGFVYHFLFPIKKAGPYQYRVAIRDTQGGRIGSASQFVEVPDLKKKRLTLSSIVLENLSESEWQLATAPTASPHRSNALNDTALRRVKRGSVLRFGFEIYNAKPAGAGQLSLSSRIRIFRDGRLVFDGKPTKVELFGQTDLQHVKVTRAMGLGEKMAEGDYVLQVIVTDTSDAKKERIASQFVQFELVN